MAKLTKADLRKQISLASSITHQEAKAILEIILDSMVRALRNGERIELRGFGTFSTHNRAPRRTRNPLSGVEVIAPAKRVPSFKPSIELRALVNGASTTRRVPATR